MICTELRLLCRFFLATCGTTLSSKSGTIESPNYPSNYNANVDCTSIVQAGPDEVVTITFTDFNLESNSNCRYDYVRLYDGSTLRQTFCGTSFSSFTTSPGNDLRLEFHSDGSIQRKGFAASFSVGGKFNLTDNVIVILCLLTAK